MKIVGLLLVRNEEWVLEACIRAALRWVDHLVIGNHASKDSSLAIIERMKEEYPSKITLLNYSAGHHWMEMDLRQSLLEAARAEGMTHGALIDADEMLTHNLLPKIRDLIGLLQPAQVLDLPMINPHRGFDVHRDDHSEHSQSQLSVAFYDAKHLTWQPRNGYHFHQRCPQGSTEHLNPFHRNKDMGGAFHLQWVCWDRLVWKHRWYALNERIRWPHKYTVEQVNKIYSAALDERGLRCRQIQKEWLGDYPIDLIDKVHTPWHKEDCERIAKEHPEALEGLSIAGWPN